MSRLAALVAMIFVLGCNPYDPNLGPAPFVCGTDEPRCPDGYTPVDVSVVRCECQQAPMLPDGGPAYGCNADLHEPNDDFRAPTVTHVGADASDSFFNIAICPAGDLDNYGLTVPVAGTLVQATVTFDATRAPPAIDLLDAAGVSLHPTVTTAAAQLVATYPATQQGIYVFRLSGSESVNYSVRIQIFLPQ